MYPCACMNCMAIKSYKIQLNAWCHAILLVSVFSMSLEIFVCGFSLLQSTLVNEPFKVTYVERDNGGSSRWNKCWCFQLAYDEHVVLFGLCSFCWDRVVKPELKKRCLYRGIGISCDSHGVRLFECVASQTAAASSVVANITDKLHSIDCKHSFSKCHYYVCVSSSCYGVDILIASLLQPIWVFCAVIIPTHSVFLNLLRNKAYLL